MTSLNAAMPPIKLPKNAVFCPYAERLGHFKQSLVGWTVT